MQSFRNIGDESEIEIEQVLRRGYLEALDRLRDKNLIKAVTGARRGGKSTLLATQKKYYTVDPGFRNALLGKELSSDSGHSLENVVFLELLRRRNQVWVGKIANNEVDFVVRDSSGRTKYSPCAFIRRVSSLRSVVLPLCRAAWMTKYCS
jgi:predicted AAA+ superfamily ATPase